MCHLLGAMAQVINLFQPQCVRRPYLVVVRDADAQVNRRRLHISPAARRGAEQKTTVVHEGFLFPWPINCKTEIMTI